MFFLRLGFKLDDNPDIFYKKKKSVSFNKLLNVILIPTKEEYTEFRDNIWYNLNDYKQFALNSNLQYE